MLGANPIMAPMFIPAALERPRGDEQLDGPGEAGEAARERREREDDEPPYEDGARPEAVTEAARDEKEHREAQEVRAVDPADGREGRVERRLEGRDRDVDDGRVDHDDEEAEAQRGQDAPRAASAQVDEGGVGARRGEGRREAGERGIGGHDLG